MILVTGATGKLGGHVVRALRRLGQPVRALVRRGSPYYRLNDTGCSYLFGDLRDPASLARACRGARAIVVCSGVDRESRDNHHANVTAAGHAALFRAGGEHAVERVVLVSAIGVDRGYPTPWFDARRQAEQALAEGQFAWTILRAPPTTAHFARLAWGSGFGGAVAWGSGRNRVSPIGHRDLALTAVAALEIPEWRACVVEVAAHSPTTPRELVALAMAESTVVRPPRWVPSKVARWLSAAARPLGRRWVHQGTHRQLWLTDDFVADPRALREALGGAPTPLAQSLREDMAGLAFAADPVSAERREVHRDFDPTIYVPGEAPIASLPTGPLRYDP